MVNTVKNIFRRFVRRLVYRPHAGNIGIGLVGVGGWGWSNACQIMKTGRFDIRGFYDTDPEICRRFSSVFDVRYFDDYEIMLAEEGIEAVAISTPNFTHVPLVSLATDAGKHIFVEKPLASGSEQC